MNGTVMLKKILTLTILLTTLITPSFSYAGNEDVFERVMATKTLNLGYFVWDPYFMKDPNTDVMSGISYDIMEAIGRTLGLKTNWVMETGVGEVGAALEADKFDVMGITIWPSPARYNAMTFSVRPQFYANIYGVARTDDNRFNTNLANANTPDVTVVGMEGDFSADLAKELLPNSHHVNLPASASAAEYLMQVVTKKADLLFIDKGGVNEFSKTNPGQIKLLEELGPVRVFGEHIAVKRGEYQLRDMLDVALLQLINDGTIKKLVEKYRDEYKLDIYPPRQDYQ